MGSGGQMISVYPEELMFEYELDKPSYCNIKVVNNTEHHVAFKVKTTSPKKYFVRPNTSVVQPRDSCAITVTLQPQKEYPLDMQCKDKFLIQSAKVPPGSDTEELPSDTFNKDDNKVVEELKLRVLHSSPQSGRGSSEESGLASSASVNQDTAQRLKDEMDAAIQQNNQLRRELEMLKARRSRKGDAGYSLVFAAIAGLLGVVIGYILKLSLASPAAE